MANNRLHTNDEEYFKRNLPFKLNIKQVLLSKGIHQPYAWLRKIGISHGVVHKLLRNKQNRITVKQIGKMCEALYCTPNDLFAWYPSSPTVDVPHHPLQKLKPKPLNTFKNSFKDLSPDKIAEAHEYLIALAARPEVEESKLENEGENE